MGKNGGFEGEIHLPGGSFSKLLLASDDVEEKPLCVTASVSENPLFSSNTPSMLCFGDFGSKITPKPTVTSVNNTTNITTSITNVNKRRNGSGKESGNGSGNGQKNGMKKNKPEVGPIVTSSHGHAKGKRVKLGERISVLQQLVCPYGRGLISNYQMQTDTASVLHEAMGYMRFLQDQVKVLSTPYLKRFPCLSSSSSPLSPRLSLSENSAPSAKEKDSTQALRNSGLCLVPLECIFQVANSNGADFWSPTISSSEQ